MDLATLRAAQPDQLQRAAQDWDAAASRLEKLSADFRTQTGTLFEGSWAGAAADAARASLSGMSARLTATNGDMAAMAALYRDAAMGVSDAQALLRTAEDLAASNGLVIGASGEVSLAAPALGGHGGLPAAYLLGFSAAGIGKAIVAFGDPDTAATTVTYVPGVGTTLTGALSNSQRAANLWRQAHRGDPGQSLSSVFWLDYNAPRRGLSLAGLMADRQIGSVADAVAGAKSLAGFQAGLAAAHVAGVPDRTVLLGHSYGSLVVGEAAAHDGVRPGDSIFVDSPGVGVNHAAQLGVPASHVWAGANVNDPIPDMPHAETLLPGAAEDSAVGAAVSLVSRASLAKGAEVGALLPLMLAHLRDPNASYYGINPAAPAFGGNDFTANAVPGEPPGFSLPYFLTFKAHSSYWAPGSASLLNMARIVNRQYGLVSLAPGSPAGSGS